MLVRGVKKSLSQMSKKRLYKINIFDKKKSIIVTFKYLKQVYFFEGGINLG
jgi:hypothetical protein